MAGRKPESFTDEENRRLRHVLRTMKEQHRWSQAETGRRLKIGQQAAGTILNKNGGFSRPTALELARLCGFDSPETLLSDLGVTTTAANAPSGWAARDRAAGIARHHGYNDRAIERVIARYTEPQYEGKPIKWWMTKFGLEDQELAEEARAIAAPPPSTKTLGAEPTAPRKPRRQRRTA